jgi:hypothetical protein
LPSASGPRDASPPPPARRPSSTRDAPAGRGAGSRSSTRRTARGDGRGELVRSADKRRSRCGTPLGTDPAPGITPAPGLALAHTNSNHPRTSLTRPRRIPPLLADYREGQPVTQNARRGGYFPRSQTGLRIRRKRTPANPLTVFCSRDGSNLSRGVTPQSQLTPVPAGRVSLRLRRR